MPMLCYPDKAMIYPAQALILESRNVINGYKKDQYPDRLAPAAAQKKSDIC